MATDAKFDIIQNIIEHDNADTLEVAIVSNFPCVVRKGEFKKGDWCLYIRDDAKLLGYDELQERKFRDKLASQDGSFVTQDCFTCSFQWQQPLLKYLGGGGRVKTVKLRGKVSMGILLKPETVCPNIKYFNGEIADYFNRLIQDKDTGSSYLEKNFGIMHWIPPSTGFGALNVKFQGLPCSLAKSDQENWENLDESDLHLGATALLTKKLDGTSTTVTCYPDERGYEVSSRSLTFNVKEMTEKGEENVYTKFTQEAVKAGLWYAKTFGCTIAIRGETCCSSVQCSSYNKDCKLNGFFVYACEFPDSENWHEKHGTYGTSSHFTEVVKKMNEAGFNVKTVPVLGEAVVTKDLLKKYNDIEWSWGEGVVLNIKVDDMNAPLNSFVWSYKSKSREYLMKMK